MAGGRDAMNTSGFVILFVAAVGLGQSQTARSAFDVVSIKPRTLPLGQLTFRFAAPSGSPTLRAKGNRFTERMATVQDLIMGAYQVNEYQILNMPDWVRAPHGEHYDIDAKSAGDEMPSQEQLRLMVQSL